MPSRPRAIIITGPESTDSTYVTRLIAHVMGVTTRGLHGGFAGNIGYHRCCGREEAINIVAPDVNAVFAML